MAAHRRSVPPVASRSCAAPRSARLQDTAPSAAAARGERTKAQAAASGHRVHHATPADRLFPPIFAILKIVKSEAQVGSRMENSTVVNCRSPKLQWFVNRTLAERQNCKRAVVHRPHAQARQHEHP